MDLHIKDVLSMYLKKDKKINDAYYTQRIMSYWQSELSPSISSRTTSIIYNKGVLIITVDSAALRHELFCNRDKIMTKVNEYLDQHMVYKVTLR
jgi:Protein of unknown function (DUF721).